MIRMIRSWTTRLLLLAAVAALSAACQGHLTGGQAPQSQGTPPAVSASAEPPSQSLALVALLKGEATDRQKIQAAEGLGGLAASGDRAALDGLLQVLGDPESGRTRIFAAMGLIKSRRPEATTPLIGILKDRTLAVQLRKEAAFALGSIGEPAAVEPLVEALQDPTSAEIRLAAATALWAERIRSQTPQTPILLAILKDREQPQFYRARAALLLSQIGDATAVEPLIELLRQEPRSPELTPDDSRHAIQGAFYGGLMNQQRNIRARIAGALGALGDGRAVRPLLQALHGAADDRTLITDARGALTRIEGRVGLDPVLAAAKDQDAGIRREAVAFLGRLGKPEAEGALTAALKDADPAVREAAAAALDALKTPAGAPAPSDKEKPS